MTIFTESSRVIRSPGSYRSTIDRFEWKNFPFRSPRWTIIFDARKVLYSKREMVKLASKQQSCTLSSEDLVLVKRTLTNRRTSKVFPRNVNLIFRQSGGTGRVLFIRTFHLKLPTRLTRSAILPDRPSLAGNRFESSRLNAWLKALEREGIRHGRSRWMNFVIYRRCFDLFAQVSARLFFPFRLLPDAPPPPRATAVSPRSPLQVFFPRFFACLLIFCANGTSRSVAGFSLLFCSSTFRQMRI